MCYGRQWIEERDAPRIRDGFKKLSAVSQDWPLPADLLRALPQPEPMLALPAKPVSEEAAKRNIVEIQRMLRDGVK